MSDSDNFRKTDRFMGLCRMAHDAIENGDPFPEFFKRYVRHCDSVNVEPMDPFDLKDTVWRTAKAASDAWMTAKQAFPFTGDMEHVTPKAAYR